MDNYDALIEKLTAEGYLRTPAIINAFKKARRANFMPPALRGQAHLNEAMPIGKGQTISQPLTVAFMLEQLQVQPGQKVLDVGAGSGWQTALLCEIVGPNGKVMATEIVPELKAWAEKKVRRGDYYNAAFFLSRGEVGLAAYAPYGRIIVAAAAPSVPPELKTQLAPGGRLVMPVGGRFLQDIVVIDKLNDTSFQERRYPGFRFVPLINKK